jgi:hypothetical protein
VVVAFIRFVIAAEIDSDEPSAFASCNDLANFRVDRLLRIAGELVLVSGRVNKLLTCQTARISCAQTRNFLAARTSHLPHRVGEDFNRKGDGCED